MDFSKPANKNPNVIYQIPRVSAFENDFIDANWQGFNPFKKYT